MNIGLSGKGKLGKAIIEIAPKFGVQILWAKSSQESWDEIWKNNHTPDVVIEVSTPETAFENCRFLLSKGIPVVCGTTGWHEHKPLLESYCREISGSFLYASNFSLGVNILFELSRKLAEMVKIFDHYSVDISETHHISKKDAPSGTAITLANSWIEHNLRYNTWLLQEEAFKSANTKEGEIPILCKREDRSDIFGNHELSIETPNDQIFIGHKALNRKGFAEGAILAAKWLKNKKGVYNMRDLLLEKGI
jgi:4-hydroxy-tetrahydrodipicolinate reductase